MHKSTSILLLAILVTATACRERSAPPELPHYADLSPWSLTAHDETAMSLDDVKGTIAVYDFIFTRCGASCPLMTSRMSRLAESIESDDVRFLSITVDPEYDTAEVLRRYREGVTSDGRWFFLTGERQKILDLSIKGFMLAAGEGPEDGEGEAFLHSTRFILVDREGSIRGYYESLDPRAMENLERDVRALLRS
jgi:cytochrome oxidase Cu insertion factor (SCO1/SenC/PrrC family)